jgi:hypothetical protein
MADIATPELERLTLWLTPTETDALIALLRTQGPGPLEAIADYVGFRPPGRGKDESALDRGRGRMIKAVLRLWCRLAHRRHWETDDFGTSNSAANFTTKDKARP